MRNIVKMAAVAVVMIPSLYMNAAVAKMTDKEKTCAATAVAKVKLMNRKKKMSKFSELRKVSDEKRKCMKQK